MSNMIQAAREQVAPLTQAAYEKAAAEGLLERLPAGIRPGELNWEALTWERETGLFLRRGRLRCRAYFLARAEEGDTVFLDFRLKGAVTT